MDIQFSETDSMQVVTSNEDLSTKVNFTNNDAHDQFPTTVKKVHQFYFVKFQSVEYLHLKAKIEEAEMRISNLNQAQSKVAEKLQERTLDRDHANTLQQKNISHWKYYRGMIDWRRKEMEYLQQALDELNTPNKPRRKRAIGVCSPHNKINDRIKTLHYRIQHGSNNFAAEKKLLREIKQAEAEREKINVNVSPEPHIGNYWGLKTTEAMNDRIKLLSNDLDKLEQEKQECDNNSKRQKKRLELRMAENDANRFQREVYDINRKKDEVYGYILQLRRQSDEADEIYHSNLTVLNNARELAKKKDVAGLKHLCNRQVEKYMSEWSNSKSFRDDYEKRMYHY